MKPMPSLGLWFSLVAGTALALCAFIGVVYLLYWGMA